jgi:hypothetical protein
LELEAGQSALQGAHFDLRLFMLRADGGQIQAQMLALGADLQRKAT